jgi:Tol biopolymer transport system component
VITRVSIDSSGDQGNDYSGLQTNALISSDGRYVVFNSYATNLVPGDTNNLTDVFVHDRMTGDTTRVNVSSTGEQANGYSSGAAISGDGRYVVFESFSSNLVPSDNNVAMDVFLHDRQTGETTLVSVDSYGNQGNGDSGGASISADGRYVAFDSEADNLVVGDTNNFSDVFVHDLQTGETTRLSVDSGGDQGNDWSGLPSVSGDGRFVAFMSWAKDLVPEDRNGSADVFVHARLTGETTRVSVDSAGHEGKGGDSRYPSISANGRFVAFDSFASGLTPDARVWTVNTFLHDRHTGETTDVSADAVQRQTSSAASVRPSISADGRYVAFESWNGGLVSDDTNNVPDVFVSGPELTLDAHPTVVAAGQILTLTEYKGVPNNPASLWAVNINGTPVSLLILSGSIGHDGDFVVSGVVPPGLSGDMVDFRAYALGQSDVVIRTNDVAVSFQ